MIAKPIPLMPMVDEIYEMITEMPPMARDELRTWMLPTTALLTLLTE